MRFNNLVSSSACPAAGYTVGTSTVLTTSVVNQNQIVNKLTGHL